jgi:hypothetical protein
MKLKFALIGLVALSGAALSVGTASAMPLAPLEQSQASNVENVALVCGPRGCVRTAPVYRYGVHRYGYGVHRGYGYGVHRGYGYHRGYRRY